MPMIQKYLSLVKFSHTVFALPFALVGLALGFRDAQVPFDAWKLLYVLLCMVFARIAALCRREAIAESLYYSWSKEFLGEVLAGHGFKRHAERYPHIDSRGRAMLAITSLERG